MDIFCEHMVKKKKTVKDVAVVAAIITAGVFLTLLFLLIAIMLASAITFSIYAAVEIVLWYAVYIFISRQNIEYEFILTNGDLEVDSIYSKKRRVHMISTRVKDFEICAPLSDRRFQNVFSNLRDIKKIYSAHSFNNDCNVYFADFYYKAQKVRLIFEPSDEMLKKMKIYNERNVHLQEMK